MRFSIRISILQTFALLLILTVVGVTVVFYLGSSRIMVNLYSLLARVQADKLIERTVAFMEAPARLTRMTAVAFEEAPIVGEHEKIWDYLWKQLMLTPQVASYYLADPQGNFIQTRRVPEMATRLIDRTTDQVIDLWHFRNADYGVIRSEIRPADYDPRTRPWYKATRPETGIYWSDVYRFQTTQEPGITGTCPIRDQKGSIRSIVGVDITLNSLAEFVASQRLVENGKIFIMNDAGEVITAGSRLTDETAGEGGGRLPQLKDLKLPWFEDAYRKHLASDAEILSSTTGGRTYLGFFFRFPASFDKKWKIAAVIPEAEVVGPTRRIIYKALLITALITLTCLLLVYAASGWITRPVKRLVQEAGKIKDFRLEEVSGIQSNLTEIRSLSDAFMAMKGGLASFGRYVPAELVRQLIATGREAKLGGEKTRLAIMFTDIVGFTTLSETLTAEDLMLQLSAYLDRMTQIIEQEQGTVDKYIGDGIMAFWGAPLEVENPALLACRAALSCSKAAVDLNRQWRDEEKPAMPTCFGIHFGETIVGNVGSSRRMNYSIFGDNVNLASRLEGINRIYGTKIIVSQSVYEAVDNQMISRPLDIVAVKGKKKRIAVHELLTAKDEEGAEALASFCARFAEGIEEYRGHNWEQALAVFDQLQEENPDDRPVQMYIKRCRGIMDGSMTVTPDWDGSVILNEK
ncbi:MAG: adenylate/guanylate cyclase domain-containing protein [Desulfobacterales bacterium]|jgi:adenylate cyclase